MLQTVRLQTVMAMQTPSVSLPGPWIMSKGAVRKVLAKQRLWQLHQEPVISPRSKRMHRLQTQLRRGGLKAV